MIPLRAGGIFRISGQLRRAGRQVASRGRNVGCDDERRWWGTTLRHRPRFARRELRHGGDLGLGAAMPRRRGAQHESPGLRREAVVSESAALPAAVGRYVQVPPHRDGPRTTAVRLRRMSRCEQPKVAAPENVRGEGSRQPKCSARGNGVRVPARGVSVRTTALLRRAGARWRRKPSTTRIFQLPARQSVPPNVAQFYREIARFARSAVLARSR